MKHYFHILILIFVFFWNVYLFADVNHVIVYTNGLTDIGLIDSLSTDSVYFHDFDNFAPPKNKTSSSHHRAARR